jgi:hypothetical protein
MRSDAAAAVLDELQGLARRALDTRRVNALEAAEAVRSLAAVHGAAEVDTLSNHCGVTRQAARDSVVARFAEALDEILQLVPGSRANLN